MYTISNGKGHAALHDLTADGDPGVLPDADGLIVGAYRPRHKGRFLARVMGIDRRDERTLVPLRLATDSLIGVYGPGGGPMGASAIPNALAWTQGNVVALDLKDEFESVVGPARRARGEEVARLGAGGEPVNPLAAIDPAASSNDRFEKALELFQALVPPPCGSEPDQHLMRVQAVLAMVANKILGEFREGKRRKFPGLDAVCHEVMANVVAGGDKELWLESARAFLRSEREKVGDWWNEADLGNLGEVTGAHSDEPLIELANGLCKAVAAIRAAIAAGAFAKTGAPAFDLHKARYRKSTILILGMGFKAPAVAAATLWAVLEQTVYSTAPGRTLVIVPELPLVPSQLLADALRGGLSGCAVIGYAQSLEVIERTLCRATTFLPGDVWRVPVVFSSVLNEADARLLSGRLGTTSLQRKWPFIQRFQADRLAPEPLAVQIAAAVLPSKEIPYGDRETPLLEPGEISFLGRDTVLLVRPGADPVLMRGCHYRAVPDLTLVAGPQRFDGEAASAA